MTWVRLTLLTALALVVLTAPATGFDLTGTWSGTRKCLDVSQGVKAKRADAVTFHVTQTGNAIGILAHNNWRLPTLEELRGIADYTDSSSPTVLAVFDTGCTPACTGIGCSCTAPGLHWTDDLVPSIVGNAWVVDFGDGSVLTDTRDTTYYARAVR